MLVLNTEQKYDNTGRRSISTGARTILSSLPPNPNKVAYEKTTLH